MFHALVKYLEMVLLRMFHVLVKLLAMVPM